MLPVSGDLNEKHANRHVFESFIINKGATRFLPTLIFPKLMRFGCTYAYSRV
jgi:hypothetical protein